MTVSGPTWTCFEYMETKILTNIHEDRMKIVAYRVSRFSNDLIPWHNFRPLDHWDCALLHGLREKNFCAKFLKDLIKNAVCRTKKEVCAALLLKICQDISEVILPFKFPIGTYGKMPCTCTGMFFQGMSGIVVLSGKWKKAREHPEHLCHIYIYQ